jgi:uncharacterized protein (TIGR02611 family)
MEGALRDDPGSQPTATVVDRATDSPDIGDPGTVTPKMGLLDRIRSTRSGRITLKVVVAILGVAIILLGILMIPLPGPGWLVVFAGLAILSVEYVWAKHLLHFARQRLTNWTHWVARQSWLVRIALGAAGLVLIGLVGWLALRNGTSGEWLRHAWRFLTSD